MKNVIPFLEYKAYHMRYWSVVASAHAGSGHPTTCLSAADIVSVLFFYVMKYDAHTYENPDNDRFILSKGHASALLYAAWHEVGVISDEQMLTYRNIDSVLEGHPTLRFECTEAATGSLGIGLSIGVGEALCAKIDKRMYRTYVLMGDSETSEGSVWEAVQLAVHYKLDNLIAIIDCNRLGQSTESMLDHKLDQYEAIFSAFGWETFVVDGHTISDLIAVFDKAHMVIDKPVMILAKTIKGYGINFAADKEGFHGKAFVGEQLDQALADLKKNFSAAAAYVEAEGAQTIEQKISNERNRLAAKKISLSQSHYKKGEKVATRKAYGHALSMLGDVSDDIICLDAEVKNSTFADIFEAKHPDRFFQCFIAEQNMFGMGIGLERRGKIPFISTFSSFFSRAHDQIRMAAIGNSALRLVGSHCGVSIGQDGPSQMGLEDIATMRCLPDSIVLYPSDAVSTHKLVNEMANYTAGISYLRTTRMETSVLYDNDEQFAVGGCKIVRQSAKDVACIIAAGVTLHEALAAYEVLSKGESSLFVSIIDLYSVKPLDTQTIITVARSSGNRVITVEDHYSEGGIGEAVAAALAHTNIIVESLAVSRLPRSGKPEELLAFAGIDAAAIVQRVKG